MEEIALGEMGMTESEFDQISLRSLFNKLVGFRKSERDQWERTRAQTYILLSPHFKENTAVTPQEVFPLPWDGEIMKSAKADAQQLKEKRNKLWAQIDAQKNKLK